jgi:hypothetical protein
MTHRRSFDKIYLLVQKLTEKITVWLLQNHHPISPLLLSLVLLLLISTTNGFLLAGSGTTTGQNTQIHISREIPHHALTKQHTELQTNKQTNSWPRCAGELYRPRGRSLSANLVPIFAGRGCRVVSVTDPYGRILGFVYRSRYFFFLVDPQLYSRGWVDSVPDSLRLGKPGSAGNRTRNLWICSQELWPLDHSGVLIYLRTVLQNRGKPPLLTGSRSGSVSFTQSYLKWNEIYKC